MTTLKTTLLASALTLSLAAIAGAQAPKTPTPAPAAKTPTATPAAATTAAPAAASHMMMTPKQVVWGAVPPTLPPGAKFALISGDPKSAAMFTFRLEMPNGYVVAPHFHPGEEHVTVISGNFSMGMGDTVDKKAAMSLPAGSYMIMPKGEHHYGFAKGKTVVQVHAMGPWGITYVNPADDPRNKATPAAAPAKK